MAVLLLVAGCCVQGEPFKVEVCECSEFRLYGYCRYLNPIQIQEFDIRKF